MSKGCPKTETLDKVYLPERLLTSDYERISKPDEFGRGVEFIRKEAFLEWAKEYKKAIEVNGDENDAYTRGEYSAINSLIDKINSL